MVMPLNLKASKVHPNVDVLCGRGGNGINKNPGNLQFRAWVELFKPQYMQSIKVDKVKISARIVAMVHHLGGRYLSFVGERWHPVPGKKSLEKTSQALRELPKSVAGTGDKFNASPDLEQEYEASFQQLHNHPEVMKRAQELLIFRPSLAGSSIEPTTATWRKPTTSTNAKCKGKTTKRKQQQQQPRRLSSSRSLDSNPLDAVLASIAHRSTKTRSKIQVPKKYAETSSSSSSSSSSEDQDGLLSSGSVDSNIGGSDDDNGDDDDGDDDGGNGTRDSGSSSNESGGSGTKTTYVKRRSIKPPRSSRKDSRVSAPAFRDDYVEDEDAASPSFTLGREDQDGLDADLQDGSLPSISTKKTKRTTSSKLFTTTTTTTTTKRKHEMVGTAPKRPYRKGKKSTTRAPTPPPSPSPLPPPPTTRQKLFTKTTIKIPACDRLDVKPLYEDPFSKGDMVYPKLRAYTAIHDNDEFVALGIMPWGIRRPQEYPFVPVPVAWQSPSSSSLAAAAAAHGTVGGEGGTTFLGSVQSTTPNNMGQSLFPPGHPVLFGGAIPWQSGRSDAVPISMTTSTV